MSTPAEHSSRIPTAALLSIGDELALGQTLDTNSAWMAERLFAVGIRVTEHATVADDAELMVEAFRRLSAIVDIVICTGGLGPTADDLTREAVSELVGEDLVEDEASLSHLEQWFADRGGLPAINRVQALRPRNGLSLENPQGTAPGLRVRDFTDHTEVFCLPGPPHEMRPMFERFVIPYAEAITHGVTQARLLLTFGLGESRIAELLGPLMDRDRESRDMVVVGTTASMGVVTCRLRATGSTPEATNASLDNTEADIRQRFTSAGVEHVIFDRRDLASGESGATHDALPREIVRLLGVRGEQIAVVESCTGGLLGGALTEIPGSSDVFVGGWQTYTNTLKHAMVGVPTEIIASHGAVSSECANAMARGALNALTTLGEPCTHAVSITGIAGPGGGSEDKPVGTVWIGVATANGSSIESETRRFAFWGDRTSVRNFTVRAALGMLRLRLIGHDMNLLGQVERICLSKQRDS